MKKKIGVVLSGCGVFDGAEIHESVLTLLAIDRAGAEAICMAPNIDQLHVINHATGEEMDDSRNVLIESARISRGNIEDIAGVTSENLDALIFPGGFGVAKKSSVGTNHDVVVRALTLERAVNEYFYRIINSLHRLVPLGLRSALALLALDKGDLEKVHPPKLYFSTLTLMGSQSEKLLSMPTMRTFWVPEVAPMARRRVVARRNPIRRLLKSMVFMPALSVWKQTRSSFPIRTGGDYRS